MTRYHKKSMSVEAERFLVDKKPWPVGVVQESLNVYTVQTSAGPVRIINGDWILTEDTGGRTIYPHGFFSKYYEED